MVPHFGRPWKGAVAESIYMQMGVQVKVHAQILGGDAVVLMLFGSQEQSPSKGIK
jgi:hypothetical protein